MGDCIGADRDINAADFTAAPVDGDYRVLKSTGGRRTQLSVTEPRSVEVDGNDGQGKQHAD